MSQLRYVGCAAMLAGCVLSVAAGAFSLATERTAKEFAAQEQAFRQEQERIDGSARSADPRLRLERQMFAARQSQADPKAAMPEDYWEASTKAERQLAEARRNQAADLEWYCGLVPVLLSVTATVFWCFGLWVCIIDLRHRASVAGAGYSTNAPDSASRRGSSPGA